MRYTRGVGDDCEEERQDIRFSHLCGVTNYVKKGKEAVYKEAHSRAYESRRGLRC